MKRIAIDLNATEFSRRNRADGSRKLGAVFRASHFAERTLPRHSPLGKTKKIRSPETGKRLYRRQPESELRPSRDSRATDRLRGIVEAHA